MIPNKEFGAEISWPTFLVIFGATALLCWLS